MKPFSSQSPRGRAAAVLISLMAALAVTGLDAPATAGPVDKGHFVDVRDAHVPDFCPTIGVDIHIVEDIHFVDIQHNGDPFPRETATHQQTNTLTNLATGKALTQVLAGNVKISGYTDNNDGTFTQHGASSGPGRTYGPDGHIIEVKAGLEQFDFLLDADGNFLDFLGFTKMTGTVADLTQEETCRLLELYTG